MRSAAPTQAFVPGFEPMCELHIALIVDEVLLALAASTAVQVESCSDDGAWEGWGMAQTATSQPWPPAHRHARQVVVGGNGDQPCPPHTITTPLTRLLGTVVEITVRSQNRPMPADSLFPDSAVFAVARGLTARSDVWYTWRLSAVRPRVPAGRNARARGNCRRGQGATHPS